MLEIALLGAFDLRYADEQLVIPTRKAQALFAFLLLNRGRSHRRERLAGLLWPDSLEETARSNLRHELWRLRKVFDSIEEPVIVVDRLTLAFNSAIKYALDVEKLELAALSSTTEELIAALAVYNGELLPGFYEEWVFSERQRLQGMYETQMTRLLERLEAEARWSDLIECSTRWIANGIWPEPAYRALITAYANNGDLSRAITAYERFNQGVQKDLGLQPSSATQKLFQKLKSGWLLPSAGTSTAPPEINAVAASLTQALPVPGVLRSNLPKPLTSFIGREREIEEASALIQTARLTTITGPGGVGKTRLSIEIGRKLITDYADGIWWVGLAPISATSLLGATIDVVAHIVAQSLRVPETPGRAVMDDLLDYVRERELLLVFDNCEHLIDACAAVVAQILSEALKVSVLATSRESLGVPGEKIWPLESLSLPGGEAAIAEDSIDVSEAIRLFLARASDTVPDYTPDERDLATIALICTRLDGIPLAIELAAARIKLMTPTEILARLDHRFDLLTGGNRTALLRHQTLLATISWSFDLLEDVERLLFCRLAIFAGSFTLEAAESVCSDEQVATEEILTLLGRLIDKSLVQVDHGEKDPDLATRFSMLDTICSYAHMKLQEMGQISALRNKHAAYYVQFAETAEPHFLLMGQIPWLKRVQAESNNIRAVFDWSYESDQAEIALRLIGALTWYWFPFWSLREATEIIQRALAIPAAAAIPEHRARAENTLRYLQFFLGDTSLSSRQLEQTVADLKVANDDVGLARVLPLLGLLLSIEGEFELGDRALREGADVADRAGDHRSRGLALAFWGDAAMRQGDRQRAQEIYEQSVSLLEAPEDRNFLAYAQRRLGYLALERKDLRQAWFYLRESLRLNHELGEQRGVTACIASLAALALADGSLKFAAQLMGVVERRMELHSTLLHLDQVEFIRARSGLLDVLDEAVFAAAFATGWTMNEMEVFVLLDETFGYLL